LSFLSRLLVAGCWGLVTGYWRLEAGGWRLEAGGWRLEKIVVLLFNLACIFSSF